MSKPKPQTSIQQFETEPDEPATETEWSPSSTEATRSCRNCGSHVDADFARVLGDNDGIAHACRECCDSYAELKYRAQGRDHPNYRPGIHQKGGGGSL